MRASVVICTHNRAAIVPHAVRSAAVEAASSAAEVIVVDNASTDQTATVLGALVREVPTLRVVPEPVLGLSAARNRGLAEARAPIVVFLDDDATPRPGWLAALLAPYADPDVVAVGGRVIASFAEPPPAWITPAFWPAAGGFDLGERARRVHHRHGEWYPIGANISFRAQTARDVGGFSPLVGPVGRRQFVHDEADMCARLEQAGGAIYYTPAAVIDHWVVAAKLTPQYFLDRHWYVGQSAATFALRNRGLLRSIAALRWYLPLLVARPYHAYAPIDPRRLLGECQRREALGYVLGLLRGLAHLPALRQTATRPLLAASP